MAEVDLKSMSHESFEELCHSLLSEEYGEIYKPVDGRGGDQGIDGHTEDYSEVFQIKFYKSRPRPSTFVKDIEKVTALAGLKSWTLIIPDNPTPRLYELIEKEKAVRPFDVQVVGKTWILALLDKHESVRQHFFEEVAKEKSVRKVLDLAEYRERKAAEQHNDIRKRFKKLEKKIDSKKPNIISVERHPESLTPEHEKEITDEVERIVKVSKGQESF